MQFFSFIKNNLAWLGAGALLAFLSSFGQTFFISIFSGHIRAEFGLSHSAWGGIYSLGTGASALVMIWAGITSDYIRTRTLGTVVIIALALSSIAMANLYMVALLPVVIFALRLLGQGMCSHLSVVAMSRWFVVNRGRALSIAGMGFSLAEASLPVLFVFLMGFMHWRSLWWIAAFVLILATPMLRFLLSKERAPQSVAEEAMSLGMKDRHWTRSEALRHPLFWCMVPALLGPSAFSTAFFFQQVHFAEIKEWEHITLVSFFTFFTGASVLMMVLSGWALDRFGTARLIAFYQLPMTCAFLCFALGNGLAVFVFGLFFLSMTSGSNATLPNAFWAEFYGTKHLGALKAMAAAIMVLGSAIGPGITGVLIDYEVGLETQYLWISWFFIFSTVFMLVGMMLYSRDVGAKFLQES
ncbi:MAG: MFS transporter [Marinovum sp.]|nr:MFS transporter [Marinovum sp.]